MCRLHVYASAHKAIDRQARTLRKSCAGCICNMVVGSNSDRDVGGFARTLLAVLLYLELADDTVVAGAVDSQCWSNVLPWSGPRQCSSSLWCC